MAQDLILIVDDEPDLIELVTYNLSQAGYETAAAENGSTGIKLATELQPKLIILDLMLPEISGLEVCRRLRSEPSTRHIPIIMLTAKGAEADRVVGLELGADDYVTKPFSPRELAARVRAVLRRTIDSPDQREVIHCGALTIDQARFEATYDGEVLPLTRIELSLLRFMAQRPDRALSRQEIIDHVLGKSALITDRNVDVHVASIRKKLGPGHEHIQTVRGVGYRFERSIPASE